MESRTKVVIGALPKRFLARGVKLEAPIDEPSPLRERTGADLNGSVYGGTGMAGTSKESKSTSHNEKRFTAKEKGKGRAVPVLNGVTSMEKENVATSTKVSRVGNPKAIAINGGTATTRVRPSKPTKSETCNAAVAVKMNLKSSSINETATRSGTSNGPQDAVQASDVGVTIVRAGGARRVPIGRANAGKQGVRKA